MSAVNAILLLVVALVCDLPNADCRDFAYNGVMGPDHWGEQFNACGGKHQSPININELDVVKRPYLPLELTHFDERPVRGGLLNNGHTVVVSLKFRNGEPTVSDGPLRDHGTYALSQFHFHWGENNSVGSEDRINNVSFPAELHMVFRNAKYHTFDEAAAASDGVAVLAFFFKIQEKDNPQYLEFTDFLQFVVKPGMSVDFQNPPKLNELITNDLDKYFTYSGSLTTPPCSEDVVWIDFTTPIMISTKQIERFRHLYTYDGKLLTHNFRPIQPLNNRTIYKAAPMYRLDAAFEPMSAIPFVDVLQGAAAAPHTAGAALMGGLLLLLLLPALLRATVVAFPQ